MKKPLVAFTLSFFLPGAGLAYLGKWKWAAVNLGAVALMGVLIAFFLPADVFDRSASVIAAALGAGSGALAQSLTVQMNKKNGAGTGGPSA